MIPLTMILSVVALITVFTLTASYVCFYLIFYSPKRKGPEEEYPIPEGDIYEVYREDMVRWIDESRALPHRDVSVTSFDGLTLRGKYYEYEKGAPIEILLHGYKGTALRDLSGGIYRCHALGHSVLIADHRGAGSSDGNVITFGAKESRDCLKWIDLVLHQIDPDARIILSGISMGAATVLICAGGKLPENVVGVLADCPYTSAEEIIKKVMTDEGYPPRLLYPFALLGARIFGRFNIDDASPIDAVKRCRIPVLLYHGDTDDFVPCAMSEKLYDACASAKKLVKIHGAGHGLALPVDRDTYIKEASRFFEPYLK